MVEYRVFIGIVFSYFLHFSVNHDVFTLHILLSTLQVVPVARLLQPQKRDFWLLKQITECMRTRVRRLFNFPRERESTTLSVFYLISIILKCHFYGIRLFRIFNVIANMI